MIVLTYGHISRNSEMRTPLYNQDTSLVPKGVRIIVAIPIQISNYSTCTHSPYYCTVRFFVSTTVFITLKLVKVKPHSALHLTG